MKYKFDAISLLAYRLHKVGDTYDVSGEVGMKNEIGVSVVIPNYNCLSSLPRAIDSIRIQGMNTEIIVVDDGSTDGSREWLLTQEDIKVIHSHRIGASAARNLAITHCMYELIAFLDADDYWMEAKLQHQLVLHQLCPEITFSFSDYQHVTAQGTKIIGCFDFWPRFNVFINQKEPHRIEETLFPLIFAENVVGTSTVIANKAALMAVGGFDEKLRSASDWDLWLKLAQQGSVGIVNRELCHYVSDRIGAISRDQQARLKAMKAILWRHTDAIKRHPSALIAGYSRWILGIAEYNRSQHAYILAFFQQTLAYCTQPSRRHLRAMGGDILRVLMLKRAK